MDLCEDGNEPPDSLKVIYKIILELDIANVSERHTSSTLWVNKFDDSGDLFLRSFKEHVDFCRFRNSFL
ncbi:hypothetical protein ANN_00815 [Periplaneta americana]|uniref:Uncharacterized protein n=1 Tax=Periplaneta americana TaxID=6978 RepID=A0ABQ8TU87_PERAM|nr:hypothetical protein ANN_00815 [Periplaneta americana]